MNLLQLSLKGQSIPVRIETLNYELREMTAGARDRYLDKLAPRIGPDGKSIIRFDGLQSDLLQETLFTKEGEAVKPEVIQSWPASLVNALFDEAQKLNHLNQAAGDNQPKKDSQVRS